MGQDRSLDEFVGGGSDGNGGAGSDGGDDAESSTDDATVDATDGSSNDPGTDVGDVGSPESDTAGIESPESDADESADPVPEDVEPATATYRWEPDGAACSACGATVERLWSGEEGPVCVDCKEW